MAKITEDYVNFETAKLLKEKGFKGVGSHFYEKGRLVDFHNYWWRITTKERYEAIEAPTIQMTMKWLREVHNVFIDISSRFSKNADKDICFSYSCKKLVDTYKSSYEIGDGEWLNYEQACEAAIEYCLENLI